MNIRTLILTLISFLLLIGTNIKTGIGKDMDSLMIALYQQNTPTQTLKALRKEISTKNQSLTEQQKLEYIDQIISYLNNTNNEKWAYKFSISKSRVLLNLNQPEASIETGLTSLEKYSNNKTAKRNEIASGYQSIAAGFYALGAYEEVITYRKKELVYLQKKNKPFSQRKLNALNQIGSLYIRLNKYDSALTYYNKALHYTKNFKRKSTSQASAHNNIGLVYFEFRQFDSAEYHFEIAMNLFSKRTTKTDEIMTGIVGGNLVQCLPIKGNKEKIIRLLKQNIEVTKHPKYINSLRNAYFDLGNLYFETNEMKLSETYLDSSNLINNSLPDNIEKKEEAINIYEAYISIYENTKNEAKQLEYWRKMLAIKDEVYGKKNITRIQKLLTNLQVNTIENRLKLNKSELLKSQQALEIMTSRKKLVQLQLVIFIGIGFVIILAGAFLFYYNRKTYQKQQEIDALSNKMLATENQNKANRLSQALVSLKRKSEFSDEIIKKIKNIKEIPVSEKSALKIFISNELQMDQSLMEKESLISNISESFFTKLKIAHPTLNQNDVKLCGLIFLDLSIKEISVIKNITPNSVKISKNRLSKKMGLAAGTKLNTYLNSL